MNEEEVAFINSFIIDDKKQRYLKFIEKQKHRDKFLNEFYHRLAIRYSLCTEILNKDKNSVNLIDVLKRKGSRSRVYVMSPYSDLDQKWTELEEIIEEVCKTGKEVVICCTLGELAYY